jgi:phage FluMu protein Com
MNEFRCPICNRLFFRYKLKGNLTVEVKCTRCNNISSLKIESGVSKWES